MTKHRTAPLAIVGLLAALAPPAGAAFIDSNIASTPAQQVNGGGCYPVSIAPSLLDMLTLVDPEWSAVDVGPNLPPVSDPVTFNGTIALAKVNETGDFPSSHQSYDQNTFITLDPSEMGLVATGNVDPLHGVEAGMLEVEYENRKLPLFVWGGVGDRFTGVGRWIFDCGHPDPNPPGTCSVSMAPCNINADCPSGQTCNGVNFTYHSELHPALAQAVTRIGGYVFSARTNRAGHHRATRTDVWISPDAGGASDACPITHQSSPLALLGIECYPFSSPIFDVNASDFEFDIPLPPKPFGNLKPPKVRVFDHTPTGLPQPAVTTTFVDGASPVIHTVVHMTDATPMGLPSKVGKTIFARWRKDPTPMTRLKVDVTDVEILNPLKAITPAVAQRQRCSVTTSQDCSMNPCPMGETCLTIGGPTPGWEMFAEVNGDWREAAGLAGVAAAGDFPQSLHYDVAVPTTGGQLHIHTTGTSLACLEAQLYGQSIARDIALYGLTDGATCLADQSHNPGAIDVVFTGPDFGSGGRQMSYVTQVTGDGDGGNCSITMAQQCVVNADCPMGETCVTTGGSYRLHYTITKR